MVRALSYCVSCGVLMSDKKYNTQSTHVTQTVMRGTEQRMDGTDDTGVKHNKDTRNCLDEI